MDLDLYFQGQNWGPGHGLRRRVFEVGNIGACYLGKRRVDVGEAVDLSDPGLMFEAHNGWLSMEN